MPIKEAMFESKDEESAERIMRENVSVSREKERAAIAAALLPLQQM
jgi:hypothetical protein